jgi:hypothetical protein
VPAAAALSPALLLACCALSVALGAVGASSWSRAREGAQEQQQGGGQRQGAAQGGAGTEQEQAGLLARARGVDHEEEQA